MWGPRCFLLLAAGVAGAAAWYFLRSVLFKTFVAIIFKVLCVDLCQEQDAYFFLTQHDQTMIQNEQLDN